MQENFLDPFALLALNLNDFILESSAGAARILEFREQFRQVIANARQSVNRSDKLALLSLFDGNSGSLFDRWDPRRRMWRYRKTLVIVERWTR